MRQTCKKLLAFLDPSSSRKCFSDIFKEIGCYTGTGDKTKVLDLCYKIVGEKQCMEKKRKREKRKSVLTMASYAYERHHRWCTQTALNNSRAYYLTYVQLSSIMWQTGYFFIEWVISETSLTLSWTECIFEPILNKWSQKTSVHPPVRPRTLVYLWHSPWIEVDESFIGYTW